jgi:thiamine-monophosphate kinase
VTGRGEFDVIRAIRRTTPTDGKGVVVGIGDDCAVLRADAGEDLLLTTDLLIEGRHFRADAAPEDIGWKSLAVSISDVAATGGTPRHAVVAVALRREHTGEFADRLTRGLLACAARYDCALVGGDTNATDGPVVVCVTLTGAVARGRAVLRSGARPGDAICVTGALGGSLAGRHLHPVPRVAEAAALVGDGDVHAMIDLSDGLSSDLGHIARESGVAAEIWADRIPVHADAVAAARGDRRTPLEHALDDGEDFELCFTVPAERAAALVAKGLAGTPVAHIGRIHSGFGVALLDSEGAESTTQVLEAGGFDHFRRG